MSYFNATSAIWPLVAGWHGQPHTAKRLRVARLPQRLEPSRRLRYPDYFHLKT